uniref:PGG domain-containing protein n=1 Tax=Leersia perrieri TaxID=77586 RepID=A0A0D9WYU3_9ORYZ
MAVETDQSCTSDKKKAVPQATADPQLLMASRRGDSKRLKELLGRLINPDDHDDGGVAVIVDVVPAAAAESSVLLDGVTIEGGLAAALHVVAACGDGDGFLRKILRARNGKGDTPLHCGRHRSRGGRRRRRIGGDAVPEDEQQFRGDRVAPCALSMVLGWLKKKPKTADMRRQHDQGSQGDWHVQMRSCTADYLLIELTSQRDKENGSTPLHLAASMDGLPSAHIGDHANLSAAYQPDNKGLYPIHVAASAGSLAAVETLLETCPDCATLRDLKGRTSLHAAAEKGRISVVERVCSKGELSLILNDPSIHTQRLLLTVGAPYGESRGDLFHGKCASITRDRKFKGGEEKMSENLTDAAQVLAISSVLITTVTFASAFTLPGGYRSASDGGGAAGTPVLAGGYFFDAFIICRCACL